MEQISTRDSKIVATILLFIGIAISIDVISDLREGTSLSHVLLETLVVSAALLTSAWTWVTQISSLKGQIVEGKKLNEALREDAAQWKAKVLEHKPGISAAIDSQFQSWQLTPAEAEIARFILKGLANKEIASIRNSTEQTIKHQANAIYKKSGLSSRSQLSAFFLEDLF